MIFNLPDLIHNSPQPPHFGSQCRMRLRSFAGTDRNSREWINTELQANMMMMMMMMNDGEGDKIMDILYYRSLLIKRKERNMNNKFSYANFLITGCITKITNETITTQHKREMLKQPGIYVPIL